MDSHAIDDLNSLLEAELAAVESYSQALPKVHDQKVANVFRECQETHKHHSEKLQTAIKDMGGSPATSSGGWTGLSKLLTAGAAAAGDNSLVSAMEQGEDVRLADYEWILLSMHGAYRSMVRDELLPEEKAIHEKLSALSNSE